MGLRWDATSGFARVQRGASQGPSEGLILGVRKSVAHGCTSAQWRSVQGCNKRLRGALRGAAQVQGSGVMPRRVTERGCARAQQAAGLGRSMGLRKGAMCPSELLQTQRWSNHSVLTV